MMAGARDIRFPPPANAMSRPRKIRVEVKAEGRSTGVRYYIVIWRGGMGTGLGIGFGNRTKALTLAKVLEKALQPEAEAEDLALDKAIGREIRGAKKRKAPKADGASAPGVRRKSRKSA